MAEWTSDFLDIVTDLDTEILVNKVGYNALHALLKSWMNENECLLWITQVPGANVFGSDVIFINQKVLSKLNWSFAEWQDGTAPSALLAEEERNAVKLHLDAQSSLPILVRLRRKNLPPNQEGFLYHMHFHYGFPHGMRITVAVPVN